MLGSRVNTELRRRILYFGRTSGIHGLAHCFRDNANFFARLFWVVILVASTGCLWLLLVPLVERGAEVSYTPSTLYLQWRTVFPAVTVCETYVPKDTQKRLIAHYPELMDPLNYDFKRYLTDIVYVRGTCRKSICVPCGKEVPCDVPWRSIIETVTAHWNHPASPRVGINCWPTDERRVDAWGLFNTHRHCEELLADCQYGGEPFQCCQRFRMADAEQGPCYTFNNLQTLDSEHEELLTVNRSTGPQTLTFRILTEARVSVHSSQELSTNDLDDKYKFNVWPQFENRVEYLFSLVETENDPLLYHNEVNVRGCRYHHEIPESPFYIYPIYSYGACRLARNTEHAYHHCNCVHPARDVAYKDKYCNFTGINCLVDYETQYKLGSGQDDDGEQETEELCKPSCVESELTSLHVHKRWASEESGLGALVKIQMAGLPTLRFQRNLLRTDLDLVVSVGGLLGLFFGASVLSIAEIVYLFMR